MNNKTFERIVEDSLDICKAVLTRKSKEYSSSEDKLHNFDKAKDLMRCKTKEYALYGMLAKHLVSVADMIERFEKAGELPTSNMIDEKIGDSINYFILLKACFYDDMIKAEAEKVCKCDCEKTKEDNDKLKGCPERPMSIDEILKQNQGEERVMSLTEILKQNEDAIANSMYQNPRKRLVVENLRKILKPLFVWLTDNNRFVDYEKIKGMLNRAELERDHVPDEFIKDVVVEIRRLLLPIEMRDTINEIVAAILKPPITKFKVGDNVVTIICPAWCDEWKVGEYMTINTIDLDKDNKQIYYYGIFGMCEEKNCFKTKEEAQRECNNRNNTNKK